MTAATDLRVPHWTVADGGEDFDAEVATCESFHLGVEDHGMFSAFVHFTNGGWGQGLPLYSLDEYDPETKRRYGTAFGCDYIIECIRILGSPEQAAGTRVVVLRTASYGDIKGFARLNNDGSIGTPFFPRRLADRHHPERVA